MAPMIVNTNTTATPVIRPCHLLPNNRHDWPSDDQDSYREVLGELDAWSRRHDASKSPELVDRRRSRPPVRLIHHVHSMVTRFASIDPDQGLSEG